ncbi:MAG: hypothetical protein H8E74_02505 [Gammaproteobacteria bacterium]|nr:hypothetical protein [Gammaproteobacteria bacterium]
MSVILSSMLLVLGSYIAQPEWFDNGPYEFNQKYETLSECKIAKSEKDLCVGEQPSNLYVLSEKNTPITSTELDFVECDYWAGCYIQE